MIKPLTTPGGAPYRLSWPATLAALTACATLLATGGAILSGSALVLIGLMGTLLVLQIAPLRLPISSSAHWAVRVPLYGVIIALNWDKLNDPQTWLFDTTAVSAFGMLAAAELVIQAARRLPPGESNGAAVCLLSGFTFLSACTTDQVMPIRIASPLYFAFAILSLPGFATVRVRRERNAGLPLRLIAVAGALATGVFVYFLFWTFRVPIMLLGSGAMRDRQTAETTGLSQQPTLGPTFGQHGSFQRVLRISGPGQTPYLRGLTFLGYGQGHWGRSFDGFRRGGRGRDFAGRDFAGRDFAGRDFAGRGVEEVSPDALRPGAAGPVLNITTLSDVHGLLFVPLRATGVRLHTAETLSVQREAARGVFQVKTGVPPPYAVVFGAPAVPPLVSTILTPTLRAQALRVPRDIDPGVVRLAMEITRMSPSPAAKAFAIQQYLFTHNKYSLTTMPGPGDPVSDFIMEHKAAHCEYFASAAVVLLRAAGVPARYVTGYYAHEPERTGVTIVRQQDAHAWAEAWIAPAGWTTVDATPPDGRPAQTAEPVPAWEGLTEWFADKVAALRAWLGRFTTGQILGALAALFAFYSLVRWLWKRWRQARDAVSGFAYTGDADMDDLARRYERWLRRIGAPCPPETPWEAHTRASGLQNALQFVRHYNAARFGPAADRQTVMALNDALSHLEQTKPQVEWDTEDAA